MSNINTELSVSIIIPTLDRAISLNNVLLSILNQNYLPKEVLIIDDGDERITHHIITKYEEKFKNKDVLLYYEKKKNIKKSSAVSKNIGIKKSSGDILLFLDDDVILKNDYIENIIYHYKTMPNLLGAQGIICNYRINSKLYNIAKKLFMIFHLSKNKCIIMPSGNGIYPYPDLKEKISCEWTAGCNQSYRRDAIEYIMFDEKCMYGEDLDASYRIYKKYKNSLYMIPSAKLKHDFSILPAISDINLMIHYQLFSSIYFYYKNIEINYYTLFSFYWSILGSFILFLIFSLKDSNKVDDKNSIRMIPLLKTYVLALKNIKYIKKGIFDRGLKI